MLNVVAIMGRLVADPQLRQTNNGHSVASFCVACDRGRRDANGQTQADFIDVVAWNQTAEFVCRYFAKGSLIAVDGRLQTRNFQDKNGNNRKAVEVVANNVNFTGPRSQNPAANNQGAPAQGYGSAAPQQDYAPAPQQSYAPRPSEQQAPAASYSAGSNDDFALIEDEGDLPF